MARKYYKPPKIETGPPPPPFVRTSPLKDALIQLEVGHHFGRNAARSTVYHTIAYLKAMELIEPTRRYHIGRDTSGEYKWRVRRTA